MGVLVRDPRMQARADYTEARREAWRKHLEICEVLGLTGVEVEKTFEQWLDGWEFDLTRGEDGGTYLCMTRGRLPEGGFWHPDVAAGKYSLVEGEELE